MEHIVINDGRIVVGEGVDLVAIGGILRVEPGLQLVEDLLNAVLHMLSDHIVGLTWKMKNSTFKSRRNAQYYPNESRKIFLFSAFLKIFNTFESYYFPS